jgi:hypothetical protein
MCFCLMLLTLPVAGQQPLVSIGESPTPIVRMIVAQRDGALVAIENHSDKAILAIAVIWIMTDSQGKVQRSILTSDSLFSEPPVVSAHLRAFANTYRIAPEAAWKPDQNVTEVQGKLQVTIDAVLFEDGRLLGPQKTRFAELLFAEKEASTAILNAIAASQEKDLREVLEKLGVEPNLSTFQADRYFREFVQRLSEGGVSHRAVTLRSLAVISRITK